MAIEGKPVLTRIAGAAIIPAVLSSAGMLERRWRDNGGRVPVSGQGSALGRQAGTMLAAGIMCPRARGCKPLVAAAWLWRTRTHCSGRVAAGNLARSHTRCLRNLFSHMPAKPSFLFLFAFGVKAPEKNPQGAHIVPHGFIFSSLASSPVHSHVPPA